MGPYQSSAQNNVFQDSFLGSKYFDPVYLFHQLSSFFQTIFHIVTSGEIKTIFYFGLFLLSIFFLAVLFYSAVRVLEIRKKEEAYLEYEIEEYAHHKAEEEKLKRQGAGVSKNERWVKTLNYLFSPNSGDWKLAIIEADSMLLDFMGQLGFKGDTLGEKLKSADQEKFHNLPLAWEVHTIRNRIAHEGLSFELSQHEAKRVIAIYEKIFSQFGYI